MRDEPENHGALLTLQDVNGVDLPFTLFFDYDRCNLSKIDLYGKVEWFKRRIEFVFLSPLTKMFDRSSEVHRHLNSDSTLGESFGLMIALQSVVSGIETLGAFILGEANGSNVSFYIFLRDYMPQWMVDDPNLRLNAEENDRRNRHECNFNGKKRGQISLGKVPFLLRQSLRNGLVHQGVSQKVFVEYRVDQLNPPFEVRGPDELYIGPCRFFDDFSAGVRRYFQDLKDPSRIQLRSDFSATFSACFPL
jgi:hypothetical protein